MAFGEIRLVAFAFRILGLEDVRLSAGTFIRLSEGLLYILSSELVSVLDF